MALREELERSGNWLFRWRSYLPVLVLVPLFASMRRLNCADPNVPFWDFWALFCMGVSLVGLGVRVATVGFAPEGTSGRNTSGQIAARVNTTGMYSIVRHPLYLGNFIIWLGVSLFSMTWWLTAITVLVFWLYYERIMYAEEEFLRRKFGESYVEWAARTPAFVPKLTGWRRPDLPFSLRSVIRRENPGLFGIVACFFGLDISRHVAIHNELTVRPLWVGLFAASLAVFLTIRLLKHKTTLLAVEGR